MQHISELVHSLPFAITSNSDPATDAACAGAVAAFSGDINADMCDWHNDHPHTKTGLLHIVVRRVAPLTLAALAARGDVNPRRFDCGGLTALHYALLCGTAKQLLGAFPSIDVNAMCGIDGTTPLLFCVKYGSVARNSLESLHVLLDAGAEFSYDPRMAWDWPIWTRHSSLIVDAAMPHIVWSLGCRRAWLRACVALGHAALHASRLCSSPLLACVLADAQQRLCIPPCHGAPSHQLVSEYAGMVAAFL